MRAHLRTYPAEIILLQQFSLGTRPHNIWTHNLMYVSTSAENGPAMAGPAGPVPAPMFHKYTPGGMGQEATTFYKRLVDMLA